MVSAVVALLEWDAARVEVQKAVAAATTTTEAQARFEKGQARAEEGRRQAEKTRAQLEAQHVELVKELEEVKEQLTRAQANVEKDKADLQEDYNKGLEQIFNYRYRCCMFKHNIYNDNSKVPQGMPESDDPLPATLFMNPRCPPDRVPQSGNGEEQEDESAPT